MTMPRHSYFLALLLLLSPTVNSARETPELGSPAFTTVPELSAGFDLLYEQRFAEAREVFTSWESRNPDKPFGEVAIAASYLFEELDRQGVLTSDFFLDEKKFLHGIDGNPDSQRMGHFQEALAQARQLAQDRLHGNPQDDEGLFALTLAAGMESDALSILEKKHLEALKRMKEANKYAKQLLAQRPDAADAYIAPGIANYMVGSLEFMATKGLVWHKSRRPRNRVVICNRSPKLSLPLLRAVKIRFALRKDCCAN